MRDDSRHACKSIDLSSNSSFLKSFLPQTKISQPFKSNLHLIIFANGNNDNKKADSLRRFFLNHKNFDLWEARSSVTFQLQFEPVCAVTFYLLTGDFVMFQDLTTMKFWPLKSLLFPVLPKAKEFVTSCLISSRQTLVKPYFGFNDSGMHIITRKWKCDLLAFLITLAQPTVYDVCWIQVWNSRASERKQINDSGQRCRDANV